jgi:hypothetical protein
MKILNRFKFNYETSGGIPMMSLVRIKDDQTLVTFEPSNFVDCKDQAQCLLKARKILKEIASSEDLK